MAVLLPTPHQEKEHQEKSRREQEKPRVEPGPDGGSFPCAVCSEGHREGKVPFCQKRSGKKWERGRVTEGFQCIGKGAVSCALCSYPIASIYKGRGREE